ncbi:MAG: mannose-1-phosphate guanylyltransferase/mannose-6-phosphate isomerase [Gammaproteobacteria bacterium]|nr:mannose-1-phosphate guanylyltransferase/mannose-6-phosphate isomerase [Gammaproteobacteria bacterium]MBU1624013.1 mannose-1-phosphate guanylyltransferase/mannose-6-phosphate isomerase [Gammaproteobacteria bacterium]MBU1981741.1 mannose-1-phosphate guanylyltransferase/mannose-6-phosphate isomerase [Gammaproteobacteria bacterium]
MKLIPTILCGGAGSRLWPVSRETHPKPFIRLADGQSLLQKAWLRGAVLPHVTEMLTVTNRELFFKTEDEYGEVSGAVGKAGLPNRYILEPFGRNTAPAIAAAAMQVAEKHGEDACLLILAADHLIADQPAFAEAVGSALSLAEQGKLVTFGIRPDRPETGFGYIEAEANEVKRFVEKPDLKTAGEYLASGRFLWNSGMFCFQAGVMLKELQLHCPRVLDAVRHSIASSKTLEGDAVSQLDLDASTFQEVPDDSIDYAVMEKSSNVAVVACEIGWSDIGSWTALGDLTAADAAGNRVDGEAILYEASNCFIQSADRLVAAVGVKDLIIIDTPDALLVADRNSSQNVKHVFTKLKTEGHEAHRLHSTVHRPWGTYTVLEEGPHFKIKRIEVKSGASLSLQMHHHRSEHWIVVSGMAKVVNGQQELYVQTNESTYIPAGHKHRLENPGMLPLVMIEVQSGEYLGEDDIVRFDDKYGRAPQ